jgi:hypothetical protein
MASFSINPYNNFQAAISKEYISLNKTAIQDFKQETRFDLIPGNSGPFLVEIEKYSTQFGYGALLNVPTDCNVDPTDANAITYKNPVNMTETWNKINNKLTAKNANKVWGTCNWTVSTTEQIEELAAACGEVGTPAALTKIGKKKFMERWKSTILATQVMALLIPEAQNSIKIHKKAFQWIDPISDEIITDGHSLLSQVLEPMHPDVQTNIYTELAKIKTIKPATMALTPSNGIQPCRQSASLSNRKSRVHITNLNISWIILMLFLLLMQRNSKRKSISFKTNISAGILRN